MQNQTFFLSQNLTLLLIIVISLLFALIGILYSRKHQDLSNYLTAGRNVGTLSLTTSLVASALGAWILFGPASAATWGGIGAVIGYSLGTAFPMLVRIFFGTKIDFHILRLLNFCYLYLSNFLQLLFVNFPN